MADKIVMGYWDCPYCDAKGIQGTLRECPKCGKPRGNDTKFYMKSQSHEEVVKNQEYLSEEQAQKKGRGGDWLCSYCGSYNSITEKICKGCGHERDNEDKTYFEVKKEKEAGRVVQPEMRAERSARELQRLVQPRFKLSHLLIGMGALFFLLFFISLFIPKTKTLIISEKLWDYNIDIEKYQRVSESDWNLPSDAEDVTSRQEIHHYNQVLDHYETKTRTYTERVQSGSHVEYSYSDNGDGTFTEHSHTVPDYEYVTKTEEYEDPVYVNVPVYKKKYYYKVWRWKPFRDVSTSGKNSDPYFGEVKLDEKEREGEKTKKYSIKARLKKKKDEKTYTVSEEMWKKMRVDSEVKVKMQMGEIKELVE
ncbi:MAG: hypothetical protein IJ733_05520 [Lachnospiraceae bacterium]|nr:hypothetical protein [Lachnospiraceae bacterium]